MRQFKGLSARILVALLCAALTSVHVCAQSTAQITGVVKDHGGAVIPSVAVTATQTDTGAKRTVTTDKSGSFILGDLPIGPYRLEAAAPGFRTFVQTGIVLQVNSNPVINPVLEVGQVTATVQVNAEAAMVETQNPGVGTVIDNQRVLDLPLNGREVQQLVTLAGMATLSTGAAAGLNSSRRSPTYVITAAGGDGDGVGYTLDGVNNNDPYDNLAMQLPFPDAVQEFQVETGALAAQYGYQSNAAVVIATKSGTNSFHGTAFEFVRNGDFDARNYFATARDTLKQNQFGGVLGGPIKKNKLFFFGSYQGTIVRSNPPQTISYVPTPAMVAGDFTAITSPTCNGGTQITLASKFPDGSAGFVNNQISPTRFSPTMMNLAKSLPVPPASDPCGQITYGLLSNSNEIDSTDRLDFQLSSKHSIFARINYYKLDEPTSFDGANPLTLVNPAAHFRTYELAVGETYVINSRTVNSFRAAANRAETVHVQDTFKSWAALGANISPLAGSTMAVSVSIPSSVPTSSIVASSGLTIGGAANATYSGPDPNLVDDISLVRGPHQIQFGANYLFLITNFHGSANCPGKSTVDGSWTEGNSKNVVPLADFLMGRSASWLQGWCNFLYDRQTYLGVYGQDVWKINQHLTLSYGLRWEPYIAPTSNNKQWVHFDSTLFASNVHSTVFANGPAGLIVPGDHQYSVGNHPYGSSYAKFAPRVGLAWDPKGDGRMSIRVAYGMFTEHRNFFSFAGYDLAPPYGDQISLSAVSIDNPWANYAGGNPFTAPIGPNAPFPTFGSYSTQPFNYHAPYMNQWNLNVQKQIGADWLLTANYVGNNTIHFPASVQVNPGVYTGSSATNGNLNQRRVLYLQNPTQGQYYSTIFQSDDEATANYEGLLLVAQKRVSHKVSVLANYTWSHSICNVYDTALSQSTTAPPPGLRNLWRGNCQNGDIRQVFNLSAVLQSPRFSNHALLDRIASNWQLSPIIGKQSAQFFSVTTGTDVALSGITSQPPIQVGNPYPSHQTLNNWINISAFQDAPAGQYGTLRPFSMKGPASFQWDTALVRSFAIPKPMAIGEGNTIELRFEAFNILNHPVFLPPAAALNSAATFGKIQQAGNPRILQLAAKYVF